MRGGRMVVSLWKVGLVGWMRKVGEEGEKIRSLVEGRK